MARGDGRIGNSDAVRPKNVTTPTQTYPSHLTPHTPNLIQTSCFTNSTGATNTSDPLQELRSGRRDAATTSAYTYALDLVPRPRLDPLN